MDGLASPSPRWGPSTTASLSEVEYVSDSEKKKDGPHQQHHEQQQRAGVTVTQRDSRDTPSMLNTRPNSEDFKDYSRETTIDDKPLARKGLQEKGDDIMLQRYPSDRRRSGQTAPAKAATGTATAATMPTTADTTGVHGTVDSMAADSIFDRNAPHVDVRAAEAAFHRLSLQLSSASAAARREADPEALVNEDGDFDLVTFLQHVDSEASKAGIKRKSVHVVWKDLAVQGVATTTLHLK